MDFHWHDTQTSRKGEMDFFPHYTEPIPEGFYIKFERATIAIEDSDNFNRLKKSILIAFLNEEEIIRIPVHHCLSLAFAPGAPLREVGFKLNGFTVQPRNTVRFKIVDCGRRKSKAKLIIQGQVHRPAMSWAGL